MANSNNGASIDYLNPLPISIFQTTRLGVLDIKHTSEKLKADGHPDHITIMNISKTVDEKWKQLMTHAEERRAVVFSSYNFYRAAEQVVFSIALFFERFRTSFNGP